MNLQRWLVLPLHRFSRRTTPKEVMATQLAVEHTLQQKHDDDISIFTTFPVFMAGYTFPKNNASKLWREDYKFW